MGLNSDADPQTLLYELLQAGELDVKCSSHLVHLDGRVITIEASKHGSDWIRNARQGRAGSHMAGVELAAKGALIDGDGVKEGDRLGTTQYQCPVDGRGV